MGRYSTSVTLDSDTVDKLKAHGLSVSGFARNALNAVVSEGFDDYLVTLKLKMIEENLAAVHNEYNACQERMQYLQHKLSSLKEIHDRTVKEHEEAMTVGKLSLLVQQLNKAIIMSSFDAEETANRAHQTIAEMMVLNPDFNLTTHIQRLRAVIDV